MTDRGDERIGDAERQQVIDLLRSHTGAGRLTLDEFSDLAGDVFAAKTRADLEKLLDGLPPGIEARPAPVDAPATATAPAPAGAVPPARGRARRRVIAIMSGSTTRGRWQAPAGGHCVRVLGRGQGRPAGGDHRDAGHRCLRLGDHGRRRRGRTGRRAGRTGRDGGDGRQHRPHQVGVAAAGRPADPCSRPRAVGRGRRPQRTPPAAVMATATDTAAPTTSRPSRRTTGPRTGGRSPRRRCPSRPCRTGRCRRRCPPIPVRRHRSSREASPRPCGQPERLAWPHQRQPGRRAGPARRRPGRPAGHPHDDGDRHHRLHPPCRGAGRPPLDGRAAGPQRPRARRR